MRIIAASNLARFAERHPDAAAALVHWQAVVKGARWTTMQEVQSAFSKAKVLGADRAWFEIAGGDYRLIVAFNFALGIAFIKFIGTHAEHDRIDALTVAQF